MGYKRALWHSGLTYQQTCYHCMQLVRYTDYNLNYRAWYPDGFVYCPRCKAPIRHHERFAINPDGSPMYPQMMPGFYNNQVVQQPMVQQPILQAAPGSVCPNCGRIAPAGAKFCAGCGTQLPTA